MRKLNNHKTHEQLGREYDAWRTTERDEKPRHRDFDEDAAQMDDDAKWDYERRRRVALWDEVAR